MIYVHSLVWELSNVEITYQLTGSGESESIHREERKQPEANTRIWVLKTPPRPRPVLGKTTGFRGYQKIVFDGVLFFFLNSDIFFLEACTNSE